MDPDDTMELRRKRLRFRAHHRGFREADLILGGFADRHLNTMTKLQLDRFEALLARPDWEVYSWIVGQAPVPPEHDHDVLALLRAGTVNSSCP